jgi:two-component system OmpR family sensor kinase/two-component system sensor histidine kinase QseC
LPLEGLPDEVAPVVQSLNALLQRLERSLGAQRAFVADAAHELRSPLTALKLQLQLLRRAPDEATRAAALDGLGAGIDRAARLVEQLLTLARSEPATGALERVDVAELVRGVIADMHAFALARGSDVALDAPPEAVEILGDRAALVALARNLVDNALRYAPAGTRVDVAVAREDDHALLRVDDAGPGIPAAERERVFDRFYRRASDEGGSGLGLAIVRSVAERHGATVTLADAPGGGLRVTVRFQAVAATVLESGVPAPPREPGSASQRARV